MTRDAWAIGTSDILVSKFILIFSFSFLIRFISNRFYFYVIRVFSGTVISVFISFASSHFYIYFIIVLSMIFLCLSFYAMNIE